MCSTASSFAADWLKGCHGYKKVPPPSKPLGVAAAMAVQRSVCVCECVRQTGGSELPGRHFSQQHIHTHIRDHTHIRITFPSHIQSQDQPINPPGAVFFLETSKTGPDLHSSIKPHDTYALHTCKRKARSQSTRLNKGY